ncbi:MAG: hypothetical protein P4L57_09535 [Rhizomicrobium sp.]|nr:hypothetical protein [Rhizomicrobium sp.]
MSILRITLCAAALFGLIQSAGAFGTVTILGQNAEHERITRHALACSQSGLSPSICFQSFSIDQLAGKSGTYGAVGAPDDITRGLTSKDYAHCDNGDYLNVANYPQSQSAAQANLVSCRNWMLTNLNQAVNDAAALLKNGKVDDSQIPTAIACSFNGRKGRAKCNVIEDFGLTLHALQDIYSHSNWSDQAGPGAISTSNAPGLRNNTIITWLNFRSNTGFPPGLISGCFILGFPPDTDGQRGCPNRATHYYLNKDKGQIDPSIGKGTTPRGQIDSNFGNAVNLAIRDTRDKWDYLREQLVARYGQKNGNLMICALTHDNAAKDCK